MKILKWCNRCEKDLALSAFWKNKHMADGLQAYCKKCVQRTNDAWAANHPSYKAEQIKAWRKNNKERYRKTRKAYRTVVEYPKLRSKYLDLRLEFIAAYGGKCECCGEPNYAFLTLEHKNRDGKQHRKETSGSSLKILTQLKEQGWPKTNYALFCMNCNWGSRWTGVCPHNEVTRNKRASIS